MDIYDSRYFVINKRFVTALGLWPYHNRVANFRIRTFLVLLMSFTMLPQFIRLYKHFGINFDKMMENIFEILYFFGIGIKVIMAIASEEKMKIVYENTAKDFQTIVDPEERKILFKYSERGRAITIGFILYMIVALMAFITIPMTPIILDYLLPLNESRPLIYICNGDFIVDSYTHYGKIYLFDVFTCTLSVLILVSVDPMYAAIVEHCLALFAIIKFTRILETSLTQYYLLEMGLTILILSINSVVILMKLDQAIECTRYLLILIGLIIHLFYLTWPSQKIINHSGDLFQNTYLNEWYESSIKCQNLLKFMALRCKESCQLTAGGLYTMNFVNFCAVVKTSASYITVFSSFR